MGKRFCLGHGRNVRNRCARTDLPIGNRRRRGFAEFVDLDDDDSDDLGDGEAWANGDSRKYSLNGYRVLLTRARKGMVIWVPSPEGEWMMDDHTLDAEALDRVARTLMETGVPLLEPS